MAPVIPGLEAINWGGMLASTVYWLGIGLLVLLIMAALIGMLVFFTYNIKVDVFDLYGSGKDGVFSLTRKKKNRVKWIKKRTAWKKLYPLFNRETLEPFDSEFIYPGNQIYAFNLNNHWVPGRINVGEDEKTIRAEINPVPYYVRNWQSLQHKITALEFSEHSFWEDNKSLIFTLAAVAFCCILAGVTIYFTYKFAAGGQAGMNALASAINSFNTIGGVGPH